MYAIKQPTLSSQGAVSPLEVPMLRLISVVIVRSAQALFTVFVVLPIAVVGGLIVGAGELWRWLALQAKYRGDKQARDRDEYNDHF